jgi:hypothetical protein
MPHAQPADKFDGVFRIGIVVGICQHPLLARVLMPEPGWVPVTPKIQIDLPLALRIGSKHVPDPIT